MRIMQLNDTFEQAWDAMMRLVEQGVDMEIYNGGTRFHADLIGPFLGHGENKRIDSGELIPDNAACSYQVYSKEDYPNSMLGDLSADDYFDELNYIIVVVVDFDGENFATAE